MQTGAVVEAIRMLDQPNMFNDERILEANAFSHPAVLDEVCASRVRIPKSFVSLICRLIRLESFCRIFRARIHHP